MLKFSGYSCLIGGLIEKTHFSILSSGVFGMQVDAQHISLEATTCFVHEGHPQGIRFENEALKCHT